MNFKLKSICLFLTLFVFVSCSPDHPTSDISIEDNQLGFMVEGHQKTIKQPLIQIIEREDRTYQSLSIKSSSGSTNILLNINYAKGMNPVGIHLLDSPDKADIPYSKNKVLIYEKKSNMLNAFNSASCHRKSGHIEITKYDEKQKLISGNFNAKVCSAGGVGLSGHKEIPNGVFQNIPFEIFKTKKASSK